ncbi:hypothetical protein [Gordonia sp. NPDC003585]|uniref:hypothetical protein n=1 Tax=Gordonia sp. NPDC003585 TaxID=3154275 RepID=UPI00339EC50C
MVGVRLGWHRCVIATLSVVLAVAIALTAGERGVAAVAAPSKSPAAPTECVGSRFATLGAVYDAIFDSFLPMMPAQIRDRSASIKAQAHRDMGALKISTLAVSTHPYDLGADERSPIMKYRDPVSQWIVTQLVNVRDGHGGDVISVENLTVAQAVETVWLYLYVTVMVPLTIARRSIPSIGPLVGPFSIGTLLTLPIVLGVLGATAVYNSLSSNLVKACIVSVTESQKRSAGKPVKDLRFTNAVPAIVRDIASQVSVADPKTCPAIGNLPVSRIVDRTSTYLRAITRDAGTQRQIGDLSTRVQTFLRSYRVPHNLIPADPADFNSGEGALSQIGLILIPYVGGAPLDIAIGLNHNLRDGHIADTVPLSDLTVTKSLTAAYYTYALTAHFIELIWRYGASDPTATMINSLFPGAGITADMIPRSTGIIGAPNLYGLVVFHNVLRSLCLTEDKRPASTPRW